MIAAARNAGSPTASSRVARWWRQRRPNVELMKENPQSRLPTLRLADGSRDLRLARDLRISRHLARRREAVSGEVPERLVALRRHALGDGMLDTMLMWRGEQLRPAASQSIKHMQAWKLKTNVSVDMLEERKRRARDVALLDRPHRDRRRARLYRLPLSELRLAQRASAPRQVVRDVRGAALRQGEPSLWTSHDPRHASAMRASPA
jgi:hypothetical protein